MITPERIRLSMETRIRKNSRQRSTGSWWNTSRRLEDQSLWADRKVPRSCFASFWNGERATINAPRITRDKDVRCSAGPWGPNLGAARLPLARRKPTCRPLDRAGRPGFRRAHCGRRLAPLAGEGAAIANDVANDQVTFGAPFAAALRRRANPAVPAMGRPRGAAGPCRLGRARDVLVASMARTAAAPALFEPRTPETLDWPGGAGTASFPAGASTGAAILKPARSTHGRASCAGLGGGGPPSTARRAGRVSSATRA